MLSQDDNDLLTQTGPGTPMGEVFRRNWLPILISSELPGNDCPPVRVQVLSERLIAFRDSDGKLGLVDEFCAHRGISLWFGRNEEGGIRCPYHGWKYDVEGNCTDIPSESTDSGLCDKIKLTAYPMIEKGGVIWVYMGPKELTPPEPEWEFICVPAENTFSSKRIQECNWLQAMEGGIDSSHVSFLHRFTMNKDPLFKGAKGNQYNLKDSKPAFEVKQVDGGLLIGARRNADDENYYWRVTPFIAPTFTMIPPRGDHPVHGHFWVPIDDHTNMSWSYDYHPARALSADERAAMERGEGIHVPYIPGTFRPLQNKENDYLMDRDAQKNGGSYSGIDGFAMQDASVQESMGPIVDRTKENLVSTDNGIIMARKVLKRAALNLRDKGIQPPGVDPEHQKIRSVAKLIPKSEDFLESAADDFKVKPGIRQTSV
jgi:phenylpropionate dioxygenase-like ring-hydroxylating dioxygenase large terminal subunit